MDYSKFILEYQIFSVNPGIYVNLSRIINSCVFFSFIRPLLLDCPNKEMRTAFYNILVTTIHNYYIHQLNTEVSCCCYLNTLCVVTVSIQQCDSAAVIMEQLLMLLNKEVVESFRTCTEFFNFFHMLCTQVSPWSLSFE